MDFVLIPWTIFTSFSTFLRAWKKYEKEQQILNFEEKLQAGIFVRILSWFLWGNFHPEWKQWRINYFQKQFFCSNNMLKRRAINYTMKLNNTIFRKLLWPTFCIYWKFDEEIEEIWLKNYIKCNSFLVFFPLRFPSTSLQKLKTFKAVKLEKLWGINNWIIN